MVWAEVEIARERINLQNVTVSTLMQACIGSVMNGKAGNKHYNEMIRSLSSG